MDPFSGLTMPADPVVALMTAFVAGLLSVATPCVLPMVPITLATVGITKATSRWRAFLTAAAYVAGIVLTFTVLGVAFALTGTLFGSMLAHPATAVVLAAVFVAMAASSFGILPFALPDRFTQFAARFGGQGIAGAFAMGLFAGFIAAPCIGPVLAAILSFVATTHNVPYGALLLATYGLGFGTPFLAVGALGLKLPKAGAWMDAVKGFFGIVLLISAYWFLRGAFPALRWKGDLVFGLLTAFCGLIAFFSGSTISNKSRGFKAVHVAAVAFSVLGSIAALNAVLVTKLDWREENPARPALPAACKSHARTIVVFTAAWCPACHELEGKTLAHPRVTERLDSYGRVLIDVDANEELAAASGISGMPTVIVYDGTCKEVGRSTGYQEVQPFLKWLDSVEK